MFTFDSLSINDGHAKNVLQDIKHYKSRQRRNDGHAKNVLQDIKHYKSRQRRKKNVNILLYQLLLISSC